MHQKFKKSSKIPLSLLLQANYHPRKWTNEWPLKRDHFKRKWSIWTNHLNQPSIFRRHVTFREGTVLLWTFLSCLNHHQIQRTCSNPCCWCFKTGASLSFWSFKWHLPNRQMSLVPHGRGIYGTGTGIFLPTNWPSYPTWKLTNIPWTLMVGSVGSDEMFIELSGRIGPF